MVTLSSFYAHSYQQKGRGGKVYHVSRGINFIHCLSYDTARLGRGEGVDKIPLQIGLVEIEIDSLVCRINLFVFSCSTRKVSHYPAPWYWISSINPPAWWTSNSKEFGVVVTPKLPPQNQEKMKLTIILSKVSRYFGYTFTKKQTSYVKLNL